MRVLIVLLLCLLTTLAQAQTDEACLKWALYKEARGEGIVTQRAVLDTILNRMEKSGKAACKVLREPGQFPWAKKGFKRADFSASVRYSIVSRMDSVLGEDYLFFNQVKHPWGRDTKRIGGLYFSK